MISKEPSDYVERKKKMQGFFYTCKMAFGTERTLTTSLCWALPPQGQGLIAFDPTFGSFTLLELISH